MAEILARLDAVARERPHAIALLARGASKSFAALEDDSARLAAALRAHGVRPGDVVALSLGRRAEHVVAMLAAWRAGAAFLPVDEAAPPDRVRAMLEESRARVVVTSGDDGVLVERLAGDRAPLGAPGDALAYVIYTSGSSGRPKGVRVSHRGLVPVLEPQVRAFGLAAGKRALLVLSTAFDASISDIGTSLLAGATLVIPAAAPTPATLVDLLRAHAITHVDVPPAFLPRIDPDRAPPSLETVVIGGEVCPPAAVRAWARRARVVNVYGPTEATICTSLCACDESWDAPLLGEPLDHVRYAIDGDELLIAGPGLALGYVEQPELEARAFVVRGGERWYRTRDRVRRRADGRLEFVGRVDRQIKLRGRLVCPEEMESALRALDGVAEAAVVDDAGGSRGSLTALVAARDGAALDAAGLRERLAGRLPRWMVPRVVVVDAIPRGATGKIERAPGAGCPFGIEDPRARLVADAMASVLDVAGIAEHDDFAALGGDSLAAVEVSARAALSGVEIDPSIILRERTPAAIARAASPRDRTAAELDAIAEGLAREVERAAPATPTDDAWLVTGATGFLGRRLVPELLARTRATIHCLVRADDAARARERLGALGRHERVVVHVGDVAARDLGLATGEWRALAASVRHVVHAAAAIGVALSFEELEASNVRGALEIARFACAGANKTVLHVSTLATLAATDLDADVLDDETSLAAGTRVHGAYAQSKRVAETLLARAVPDLTIVRPGLLTGDSRTGIPSPSCPLHAFLRAAIALRCLPLHDAERLRVDVTPIDRAARLVADVATSPARPRVVHVASERGASLADLVRALRAHVAIEDAPQDAFLRAARDRLPRDAALALVASAHRLLGFEGARGLDLFLHTGRVFPCRALRAATGETIPPADDGLLARYALAAMEGRA